jgi:hypothetical protein
MAYVDFEQSVARGKLTHRMSDFVTSVWGDTAICRFNFSEVQTRAS